MEAKKALCSATSFFCVFLLKCWGFSCSWLTTDLLTSKSDWCHESFSLGDRLWSKVEALGSKATTLGLVAVWLSKWERARLNSIDHLDIDFRCLQSCSMTTASMVIVGYVGKTLWKLDVFIHMHLNASIVMRAVPKFTKCKISRSQCIWSLFGIAAGRYRMIVRH